MYRQHGFQDKNLLLETLVKDDTMADRFGLEPEERARIAEWAQAKEQARTQGPDIGVEIDSYNDDGFVTGTVTVEGEPCYFYCPNNS